MSSAISSVKFNFYRSDTNEIVQLDKALDFDRVDENGIYIFSTTFTPDPNSSFGLDLNAFRVSVTAIDEATNKATISDGNLQPGANADDFSMAVRVKEITAPHIQTDTSKWPNQSSNKTFEAHFLTWDKNSTYRLAGIDINRLKIEVNGIEQQLTGNISDYFIPETISDNTNASKENGQGYRIKFTYVADTDADYTFKVTVYDNDGNEAYAEETIAIDTKAPTVTLDNPVNGILNTNTFIINGSVDDPSDIIIVIKLDGLEVNRYTLPTENVFSQSYTATTDGVYTIEVSAVDALGNSSTPIVRTITIDTADPIFTSVKFYAILENNEVSATPATELVAGTQYKIVVQVK